MTIFKIKRSWTA